MLQWKHLYRLPCGVALMRLMVIICLFDRDDVVVGRWVFHVVDVRERFFVSVEYASEFDKCSKAEHKASAASDVVDVSQPCACLTW